MSAAWVVHKFGGTSLANAERYRQVATIMQAEEGPRKVLIVSAMHKVTDALIALADLARTRDNTYLACADALKARHVETVEALLPREEGLLKVLESDFRDIKEILRGVYLSRAYSDRTLELIAGYGELWSAQMLNAHLNSLGIASSWLDARTVLTVEPAASSPRSAITWSITLGWRENSSARLAKRGSTFGRSRRVPRRGTSRR
ncbi:MAG: hypothetical protein ABI217_09090 [Chthoniobacterales bacterium]